MYTQVIKNKTAQLINFLSIATFTFLISLNSFAYADVSAETVSQSPGTASTAELPAKNMPATPFEFIFQTVQFFLFGFFIYYMLVLRPQQLNEESHGRFLKALKKDDEVQTSSGILGKVVAIAEDFITVEVASGVKLKILKSHIKAAKQKEVAVKK